MVPAAWCLKYDTRFLLRYKPRRGPRWQNVVQHFQFNFLFAQQKTESLQHHNIFSTSILFDLKLNVISWTPEGPSVEVGSAQPSQPSYLWMAGGRGEASCLFGSGSSMSTISPGYFSARQDFYRNWCKVDWRMCYVSFESVSRLEVWNIPVCCYMLCA